MFMNACAKPLSRAAIRWRRVSRCCRCTSWEPPSALRL